jgi:hypothetical protein
VKYKIKEVTADKDPIKGSILSGNVVAYITIDQDEPRKVLQVSFVSYFFPVCI